MNRIFRHFLIIAVCLAVTFSGSWIWQATGEGYSQVQAEETEPGQEPSEEPKPPATEAPEPTETQSATTEAAPAEEKPETAPTYPAQDSGQDTDSGSEEKKDAQNVSDDSDKRTSVPGNEETDQESGKKSKVRTKAQEEIVAKKAIKISNKVTEDAPDGRADKKSFIPKIYNDTRLSMKSNKEYIAGFIYFNQGDPAWNQNGYCIARAGCGPTSMAVVITSLTGRWVTPIDTAIWGYQHGYYSAAGSVHEMIPNMAAAYGLECEGLDQEYNAIRSALKKHHPVVALMGPGYFTKGGHFMVLVAIDKDDNVTVADVGSRSRSAFKYHLKDIISQSKSSASGGGPFWAMSYEKMEKLNGERTIRDYMKDDMDDDFAGKSYMNLRGGLSRDLAHEEKTEVTVRKIVQILKPKSGSSKHGLAALQDSPTLFSAMEASETAVTVDAETGDALSADELIMTGTGAAPEYSSPYSKLKKDIADRIWSKRLDAMVMAALSAYLEGTLPEIQMTK